MSLRLNAAQIALTALCGVLAVLLCYMLFAPLPEIPVPQIAARAETVDDTPPARFEVPPKQAFAEVDERSVFNPLRTRVVGPVEPGTTNSSSLPADLSLVGVILDRETRIALFKSSAAPLAVGVAVGGSIEGWQVTRVEPDKVALRSAAGGEQELKFATGKPAATPPQSPGPGVMNPGQNAVRARFQANLAARQNAENNNNNSNANNNNNNSNDDDDDNN